MENLDGTILTTAAPSIGRSLGVPSVTVGITITAYLLTLAVLIPLSGWITRRLGSRRVFLAAIVIFTVASVLCALSTSLPELTIMRVLQGIGGAMMVPVGRLAVLRVTDKVDLIRAIALLTWPALAAPIVAPLAGGIITTYFTWHWIFLINVPLGIVAFIAAVRLIPAEARETPPPLDWIGLALTCTGLGSLVYLGSLLAERDPGVPQTIGWAVVGFGLVGFAIAHQLRSRHPLLDLRALRIETFRLSHAGGSLFRLTVNAVPFLLPLLFQDVFGYTALYSGVLVLFVFVGNLAIKPATTTLLRRFGFRAVIVTASAASAMSMALMALLSGSTPVWLVIALLTVSGVARSAGFTAYNTIAFADVERAEMTDANTLASTMQQIAAGFGVAVGAVALRLGYGFATVSGAFGFAFVVLAVLAALATVEAVLMSRTAGENIRPARG
ncbi:MAG: MFS transporter, partial [Microbacteriaceae bacterium]|nr:MFS transporter [Microbacteriaceae bacterium]